MSLEIGRYVKYAFGEENAPALHQLVQGRVSPVVMPEDALTAVPWIWYYSTDAGEDSTKDGIAGDVCTVEIEAVAGSYDTLLEMLALMRQAMAEAQEGWNLGERRPFLIDDQSFRAGQEEYDDTLQAYCRKLIYTVETHEQENKR